MSVMRMIFRLFRFVFGADSLQIPVVRQVGRGLGRAAQGGQAQVEGGGFPGKGVGPGRAGAAVDLGRRRRTVRRLAPEGECAGLCRGLGWLPVGM